MSLSRAPCLSYEGKESWIGRTPIIAWDATAGASEFNLNTGVFKVRGPITPLDIPGLCDRLRLLLICADTDAIACDVGGLIDADGAAVDALARLQLIAGRFGTQLLLCEISSELQELLALSGLDEIVGSG